VAYSLFVSLLHKIGENVLLDRPCILKANNRMKNYIAKWFLRTQ
jgi:hypothetical protein